MRVAYFVSGFPTLSETFIANQIIDFKRRGFEIHIFARYKTGINGIHQAVLKEGLLDHITYINDIPPAKERKKRIQLLLTGLLFYFNLRNLKLVLRFALWGKRYNLSVYHLIPYLDKPDFDILNVHFGENSVYVAQLRELGMFGKAIFLSTFHGFGLAPVYNNGKTYASLFRQVDLIFINSQYARKKLMSFKCPEQKIRVLPVGLDVDFFKEEVGRSQIKTIIRIIFVGRLIPLKAPDLVVEISRLLKEREKIGFEVLIIGEGDMYSCLQEKICRYDLTDNVKLLGARTDEEIRCYMEGSDIFLFPGREYEEMAETQGLVIQEAQAMKLPVIVSDAGGMAEGLLPEKSGYVVPSENLLLFAEAIERLGSDHQLRKKMGEAGRKFVMANYSIELINNRLIDFISCR